MKVVISVPKIILSALIVIAAVLLALTSIPLENKVEDNTLTVSFVIGEKSIGLENAELIKVSDDMADSLQKISGSSLGKLKSGRFRNKETGTLYHVYICGKGDVFLIRTAARNYLVDGIDVSRDDLESVQK